MTKQNLNLRTSLLAAVLLMILGSVSPAFPTTVGIGPRVGANISTLVGDIENEKWVPGWSVGGFVMYSSINHFGISADLLYSQKGARVKDITFIVLDPNDPVLGSNKYSYTERINYFEIPVLARYFLTLSGNFRPNFFIGPSVGLRLNAKSKNFEPETISGDRDITDQIRPADLGFAGGFALNFEVAPGKRVLLDARYTYGLTDITKNPNNSLRNSAITLNLSYGFGVGKNY